MHDSGGHRVDNQELAAVAPVHFSVDRRAQIVRNPPEDRVKHAHVDNRWKRRGACNLSHLLAAQAFPHVFHNAPVLTGTTTGLLLGKD